MGHTRLHDMLEKLSSRSSLEREEWHYLLAVTDAHEREILRQRAAEVAVSHFGKGVFVRGLIEISSYCRNNCNYCGIRCGNTFAERYRLTKEQILKCCHQGATLGLNTFVLQGGEDVRQNDEWIRDVVETIHHEFPEKAITLSVGERCEAAYKSFFEAGASRYLLRHETRNDAHYAQLHPSNMSSSNRRACLETLKRIGYQTGSGMMIGSPFQTTQHLVDDMMYLQELQPQMIGVGPFIPAKNTPYAHFDAGCVDLTILVVSLLRLRFPHALIPATTALVSLNPQGRLLAIQAGANVVMPNLTPTEVRDKYSIYNNKKNSGSESAQQLCLLQQSLDAIGYHIDYGRGDYNDKQ